MILNNTDRRFDPSYASPYYPNVVPMRRVRDRTVQPAVTYDLFEGFVEDWGQTGPRGSRTTPGPRSMSVNIVTERERLPRARSSAYSEG